MQEWRVVVTTLTETHLPGPVRRRWRAVVIPAVTAGVVLVDQLSKSWALGHLETHSDHIVGPVKLVLTFNPGAAFNLGTGVTPIVETVVVVLVAGLVIFSRRASRQATPATSAGLGLLLGGALGNLGDRLFRHHHGAVVDFIQAAGWWPVFNVADAAIVVGVITLVLASWAESSRRVDRD